MSRAEVSIQAADIFIYKTSAGMGMSLELQMARKQQCTERVKE